MQLLFKARLLFTIVRTVLILCLSLSFRVDNVVRSLEEFIMFSTVKRAQTSISPSELCLWMPEGDQCIPDSILLKEEHLVKSYYSFYSPTSLPTLISSLLWCLPQSIAPVEMWHVNNDSYAVSAEWSLFGIPSEGSRRCHTSSPTTPSRTHICTLLWESYEFLFQWCESDSMRRDRGREGCDVYKCQKNGLTVCFNNHTECRYLWFLAWCPDGT